MTTTSTMTQYELCLANLGEEASDRELIECVAINVERASNSYTKDILLVYAAALVFFMQAGFAMICAGAVRKKNVQNTMLKNLMDACGASLAFFAIGYAFAFGGMDPLSKSKTFIGSSNFFLQGVDNLGFWLFNYAFSAASATIVAGTLAERCQMIAYLGYSIMLTGLVYPVIARAVWNPNGFLSAYSIDPMWGVGMVDFAGSGVVHCTGGMTALLATIVLGPRKGRFHDETGRILDRPAEIKGSSMALQMLGTFILWFGWYGFNSGSALLFELPNSNKVVELTAVNTTLSGGTAGIVSLVINMWHAERTTGEVEYDLKMAMNGSLAGLVAITGGCAVVEPWAAVIIGFFAGNVYFLGSKYLVHLRIDDAVDAIPVHLLAGILGVVFVGLVASPTRLEAVYGRSDHPGLLYSWSMEESDGRLLGAQMAGLLFILVWVTAIMLPFFVWLDWKGWFRSDPLDELIGLDTSYHGGLALLTDTDGVNPEYITALQKRKSETTTLRQRRPVDHSTMTAGSSLDGMRQTDYGVEMHMTNQFHVQAESEVISTGQVSV